MKLSYTPWVLAFSLALPGLALAQTDTNTWSQLTVADRQATDATRQATMYEDIEIMGRILNRALNLPRYAQPLANFYNAYGISHDISDNIWYNLPNANGPYNFNRYLLQPSANAPYNVNSLVQPNATLPNNNPYASPLVQKTLQYWPADQNQHQCLQLPGVQGVYLPGYGVVFTLSLPPGSARATSTVASEPAKPVSEWDQVRRQVRGEKPAATHKPAPHQPTTADIILKVLAANGHHFSQLAPNEKITVVVTFEPIQEASTLQPWLNLYTAPAQAAPAQPGKKTEHPKKKPHIEMTFANRTSPNEGGKSVHEYELLAKLQIEQGKDKEAIQALRKAADASTNPRHAAELYLKIASLYLSAENDEKQARAMTNKATAFLQQVLAETRPAKNVAPRPAVPQVSKLIITASRKQLREVGSGALDFEGFRKAVPLQTVHTPPSNSTQH
ncbi:MAG TPA: hypothetical protein VFA18_22945 [Gemmataceae bacterium]|nr:hypothetical protein [Gemmataceae bacterium]